jgi:hypothetical protein
MLTDLAIRACAGTTHWVVVTNGDNSFDTAFIPTLISVPETVDLVAFDWYSRYMRPTAAPCERFAAGPGLPPCKENDVRFCNTDITANAFRYHRLTSEAVSFSLVDVVALGLNDAIVTEKVVRDGWEVLHIKATCLVNHAPNPQLCAARGGVWDDTHFAEISHAGGECISAEEGKERMRMSSVGSLEMVTINVTHDRAGSFGLPMESLEMRCIRAPVIRPYRNSFFPPLCASSVDH